jgi:RNA polymerase sigma-70 factor (ECF subfamily)
MTSYATLADDQLVSLISQGDKAAFSTIYYRYWDKLFYVAGKKLHDLYEAESIVQDIFLDLWKRREQLEIRKNLHIYLATALKYRIINIQAKRSRTKAYEEYASTYLVQQDITPEQWLSFEQLRDKLSSLVASLPERCRIAYELRDEGYSQREIAQQMKVSENTVETHIGRALKVLRTGLKKHISGMFFLLFLFAILLLA